MGMARSTYYFEINKVDVVESRNEELLNEIKDIFKEHKGRYGVRRIHQELLNRGYQVNHKRVQRLMHKTCLLGKRPKEKYHSYKGEVGKIADNVIDRDFSTTAPLQKWTTDVSQFNFSWGKCYLSPILDMHTNEVVSYDLALHPNLDQVKRMLDNAFDKFSNVEGLIFHSDYAEEKTMPKNLITSCILIIRIRFFGIVFWVSQARRLLSLYQRSSTAFRHRQLWEQTC